MKQRVITGAFILAILVPAVYVGGLFFLIIGIFLSVVASYEMMNMFYTKSPSLNRYRYIVPIFSGIIVLLIYCASVYGLNLNETINAQDMAKDMLYHFWVVTAFVAAIIICLGALIFTKNSTAHDMMACVMTLCYCGLIMGYVISIEYVSPYGISPYFYHTIKGGRSFAFLYTIVAVTDVFAYLVGSRLGKRKLCPDISPKKTVEGAIGGLIAGGVVGVICAFLFEIINFRTDTLLITKIIVILVIFVFSLVISATVQIGDLVASKLKRSYQIKDYGKIFPGHGGVLDRFDSLIFAGAAYYVIVQFIQLVLLGAA